jgi:hypothetical protein
MAGAWHLETYDGEEKSGQFWVPPSSMRGPIKMRSSGPYVRRSEFRYFKDAWRNHVSHAKETYNRQTSIKIMNGVNDFLNSLAINGIYPEEANENQR